MGEKNADVIVVGAGFAGLSAAYDLVAAGKSVIVLEARGRVGGRSHSVEIAGLRLDIGGRYFGSGQSEMLQLAQAFGVEVYPPQVDGLIVQITERGRTVTGGEMAGAVAAEYERIAGMLDEMAMTVPPDAPWTAPDAQAWDRMTADAWLRSQTDNPDVLRLMHGMVVGLVSSDLYEVSLLALLWYIRGSDGLYNAVDFENGLLQYLVKGSTHQLATRLADSLGDRIQLKRPVQRMEQDKQGVRVYSGDQLYTAQRVIVAIPPVLAGRIHYAPTLDPAHDMLLQKFTQGRLVSILAVYERPFWQGDGLSGIAGGTDDMWAANVLHVTPPGQPYGILSCFVEPGKTAQFASLAPEERREGILRDLATYFGEAALNPIGYAEENWLSDPYTRGGYGWSLPPGTLTAYGHTLRQPAGRIHWAGTETAEMYAGYLEGAVRSGRRAASEVLSQFQEQPLVADPQS